MPRPATDAGVRPLDPRDSADVAHAARMHSELLAASPVVLLGPEFVRDFYYGRLVSDGLVRCDLAFDGGEPAGFIAYTKHPTDFMVRGLRAHWPALAASMLRAVVREPSRLRTIRRVLGMMAARGAGDGGVRTGEGELLSMGVVPAFRSREYLRRTGRRISLELIGSAMRYFDAEGVRTYSGLVETRNRETLLFYHALGCRLERGPDERTVRVVGDVRPAAPGPAAPRAFAPAERSSVPCLP